MLFKPLRLDTEYLPLAHVQSNPATHTNKIEVSSEVPRPPQIDQLAKLTAAPGIPRIVPGLKRALVVGINYVGTRYGLRGCVNDALDIQSQLTGFFPMCREIRLITDYTPLRPTREEILRSISWLVSGLRPGEHVLFHYSGHGGRVRDRNFEEISGLDSCLYPINGSRLETILDDEVKSALVDRIPQGCKCLIVLDSCYSGTGADLRYAWQAPAPNSLTYSENRNYSKTAGTVLALTSCLDSQVAADTRDDRGRPCGALTMALLRTWRTYGPAIKFKHLLWDVRTFLKERRYSQIPQLSTGAPYEINASFDLGS